MITRDEIPIFSTFIDRSAFRNIHRVLKSTFISEGNVVGQFELQLAKSLGFINRPVTVNSGTSALHLALVVAGVKRGDEVICPAQTFVATAMAILFVGAIPVFADINYDTGNIDPLSIRERLTKKTKAIIPVHWAGYPCDLDEINLIAKEYGLTVIEDAAHALGAMYKGRIIGTISDFTCFSFQAIKHLATADGGAVCSLSEADNNKLRNLRWFGIDRQNARPSLLGEREYDIKEIGYKYHMNDYSAMLGLSNLVSFHKRLNHRRDLAGLYYKELSKVSGIRMFNYESDRDCSYWLFGFHVENRNSFIGALKDRGVGASVVHQGVHKYSVFKNKHDLPCQRKFDETKVHIPIHDGVSFSKARYIIDQIKKGW